MCYCNNLPCLIHQVQKDDEEEEELALHWIIINIIRDRFHKKSPGQKLYFETHASICQSINFFPARVYKDRTIRLIDAVSTSSFCYYNPSHALDS